MPRRSLLLALALFLACNHRSPTEPVPPPIPAEGVASFSGRTIDPAGAPVPNVEIALTPSTGVTPAYSTRSDAAAHFALDRVKPGAYIVTLRDQGAGIVKLLPGNNVQDLLFSNCKVPFGTVRDAATGRPIAGAKVTIFARETRTDASGHYQIDFGCAFVQGGTIVWTVEHPDYQTAQITSRASTLCTCAFDFLLERR
jgi:Carboxypeptidase regulatory-like domain